MRAAKWQAGSDVFLIALSITALIFSTQSIQSIREQKAIINPMKIFVIVCDAVFLVVDGIIFAFDTKRLLEGRKAKAAAKGQEVPLMLIRGEGRGGRGEELRVSAVAAWRL